MKIAYLYYDFLNLYGESGNVKIIERILKENKIKYQLLLLSLEDKLNFDEYDLVYIGSGTENNQLVALNHLKKYQKDIKKYIENGKFMFVTGNSLEMFGQKIDKTEALEIFDFNAKKIKREMKEIYINSNLKHKILGFRNGCYEIDKIDHPLFENEGVHYKNFFGTQILGPILVRNPDFVKYFMDSLTNKKLKYDLKLEQKAYDEFVHNFKEA